MPRSETLWSQSLIQFRDAVAEPSPTPSCGAAAVVSANLGLALVLMALRTSQTKHPQAERGVLIRQVESLLHRLADYADADVLAFADYMEALRHDESQAPNRQRAARKTSAVSLDGARCCAQALALAIDARRYTASALVSDIEAGALLVHAGLSALLINLDVDLRELVDKEERQRLHMARQQVQEEADQRLAQVRATGH
ncbi:cyclodeaminase/cyclohydrolase family protein [Pseudomonas sp.]|uniref:cyclodeaminase/cyclohydrolase family protein n=1 Tax=Pseudomonas sp. TaxID=306 RepID=UPI0028AAFAC4|nr:cyclodeaminase/cyclohydrolase family protein [Pseudomonas sp.]